jgi:hypothetical protein
MAVTQRSGSEPRHLESWESCKVHVMCFPFLCALASKHLSLGISIMLQKHSNDSMRTYPSHSISECLYFRTDSDVL